MLRPSFLISLCAVALLLLGAMATSTGSSPSSHHTKMKYPLPKHATSRVLADKQDSKLNVHVVCHTHDDVGWLKTVDQYYLGANNSIQHAGVRFVLDSVIPELLADSSRRFVYVEQAFFQRWYQRQTSAMQADVQSLVANGQLEFINGGWCMHDEANTHYVDMIDQTTLGHSFLMSEFGVAPSIGWQIDPFGHSSTQASLLSATVGFKGLFFGRIDHQDHDARMQNHDMEFVWRASPNYGVDGQIFTGAFQNGNYGPPDGFCFDMFCDDTPIITDRTFIDYNVPNRLQAFYNQIDYQAFFTKGNNIMITMGSDFQYEQAKEWYTNLDALIELVNADGKVNMFYSTPSAYVDAKHAENITWSVKTDDFFPYSDGDHAYWTGYFTSRPALKRYVRTSSAYLQTARQLDLFSSADSSAIETFAKAVGVTQHHDAVAGTAKQHVTYDYAQRLHIGQAAVENMMTEAISAFTKQTQNVFNVCPLANITVCDFTQQVEGSNTIVAVYWNPSVRERSEIVSVPINSNFVVVTDSKKNVVTWQVVQVFNVSSHNQDSAEWVVQFLVQVPALGFNTYFIAVQSAAANIKSAAHAHHQHASHSAPVVKQESVPVSESADDIVIANEFYQVTFDGTTGLLKSVNDLTTQKLTPLTQKWGYYESYTSSSGDQQSGAYIFRPRVQAVIPIGTNSTQLFTTTGPISQSVTQVICDWINQTITLYRGVNTIEIEYTVGEVPIHDGIGKEVITQYITDLQSESTWYTDSNAREMQQRIRNYRPTWRLEVTEPISGNYVPMNAAAYLNDGEYQMTILNDRSQGVVSMTDGTLEVMVHRRILADDSRGVGEPLNETQSCTPYPNFQRVGSGLVITGKHYLLFNNVSSAAAQWRPAMQRVYQPLTPFYTSIPTSDVNNYLSSYPTSQWFSAANLPYNVEVITLQNFTSSSSHSDNTRSILIRLAHQFSIGEDAELSQPVTVDLAQIFSFDTIQQVFELSLTANQIKSNMPPPLQWQTDDNTVNYEPQPSSPLVNTTVTLNPMEIRTFQVVISA